MPNCLDNDSAIARVLRAVLAIVLAVALCLPVPLGAEAVQADDPAIRTAAVPQIDLNASWAAQEGGVKSPYTIREGGVYALSDDLTADSNLIVDAAGEDVTIKFSGHKLVLNGAGAAARKTMVSIVAASAVTFDGSSPKGASSLESAGETDVWGISSTAGRCAVSLNDLSVRLSSKSNAQRNLGTHCIRIADGTLALDSCTLSMEMGNQALRSENLLGDSDFEVPSAVYASSGVEAVSLVGCTVAAEGTSGFSLDDAADTTSVGNAYAVYSQARETVVEGGSFQATSVRGNATCIYAKSLRVAGGASSPLALEANAGQLATGILSQAARSVALDAPLTFKVGSGYEGAAKVEAALRSNVEGGFVFGSCAPKSPSQKYATLVMSGSSLASANADGSYLGAFADGLASAERSAVLTALEDARGEAGSCSVTSDIVGVKFSLQVSRAVARVTDAAGVTTSWSTLDSALKKLSSSAGATLTLLKDADGLSVDTASDATIDLGGRTVASLSFTTAVIGNGLVVKNGSIAGSSTAVTHSSPSPLTLSGVAIEAGGIDVNVYGISAARAAGKLTVTGGSSISATVSQASTTGKMAYGINMASNGPELVVDNADITVVTPSAGVAAYGMYSSKAATVDGCTVSVAGTTGATCAVYAGGTLAVKNSVIDVNTTGAASTVGGIWGRTASPRATSISVDGCTVRVRSDVDVPKAGYACLMGATSQSGTSTAAWTLAGQNVFESASGMHLGMNLGSIALASGFSLGSASQRPLGVSQVQRDGNIGFTLADGLSGSASSLAKLFEAVEGSCYAGWKLAPADGGADLAWRLPGDAGEGVVEVSHGQSAARYPSLRSALAAASAGDTVRLLADVSESGVQQVSQRDLSLDLNGKNLELRADNEATAGNAGDRGALQYTGSGELKVSGGALRIEVGAVTESAFGATYQGVSVSGGGTLSIASDASVEVSYIGSTSAVAAQRDVVVRGIAVTNGKLKHAGSLSVKGCVSDGALGAMQVHGVFSQAVEGGQSLVDIEQGSRVNASNGTAANVEKNTFYAETGSNTYSTAGPAGLREITVDPTVDEAFYQDLVDQFRLLASFDDPSDSTARGTFGASIYYAQNMVIEREGAWYDGLRVWAFSDEVATADVGKRSSMVPAHVFVSTHYDTLPGVAGVATGAGSAGAATVSVKGSVEASCPHGNAVALDAQAAQGATVEWTCSGASLAASGDAGVHAVAQDNMDLRDFIAFTGVQQEAVAYSGIANSKLVRYEPASSRDASIADGVPFTFEGPTSFTAEGCDSAAVEASTFTVGSGFSLAPGSATCSVVDRSGSNVLGGSFASPKPGASVNASLFSDAGGSLKAGVDARGNAAWVGKSAYTATFKVAEAVVARYAEPLEIGLDELAGVAARPDDQRQHFELLGWSLSPDEHATGGYLPADGVVSPRGDVTYYAVYGTGLTTMQVSFTNVFNASGALQDDVSFETTYGSTVGEALDAAGKALPRPADYSKDGMRFRFVGWYPYSSVNPVAPLLYDSDQVADLEVSLAANGVSSGAGLVLRATYLASGPSQHVVTFSVDGRTSACVVDDGAYPDYTLANDTNTNYVVPSKIEAETGKTFTFAGWFDDANGDGERGSGEKLFTSILPRATADADYVADWTWEWSDVTLTFYLRYFDENEQTLVNDGVRVVETTYERDTQEVADEIAEVGSVIGFGGKLYVLDGWATRKTDVEPLYDADHPLPSVTGDDRALSSAYARTFYGVYTVSDHMVDVSFFDGGAQLGNSGALVATRTSVDTAFAATGAAKPADKSETESFLGWAASDGAADELRGTTAIEELTGSTDTKLNLYAVYGNRPTYTVRMRDAEGSNVLYSVYVRRGETVSEVLARQGVTATAPTQSGKYFAGWATAAGVLYNLDDAVYGSSDLYASYNPVRIVSPDESNITATVTIPWATSSAWLAAGSIKDVTLTFAKRNSADSPIRSTTSKNGYTIKQSYDMELAVEYDSGRSYTQTGSFGAAEVKVHVGTQYRNAKVRLFWIGAKDGAETVMNSDVKDVSSKGYVTASIGNYGVGDKDEGGNLAVAYVEGGSSGAALTTGMGASLSSNARLGSSLASSSLNPSGLSSSLSSNGLGSDSASSSGLGSSGSAAAGKTGQSGVATASSDGTADGANGSVGGAEAGESATGGLDSNVVVLTLIVIAAVALITRGLWRLLVVRPRLDEAEAEMPDMGDLYSKGITF